MALLAGTLYDPGTAVSKATTSATVMTAFDTTNLRLTFTAPANGAVLLRVAAGNFGAASSPRVFLGVLDGATVKARMHGINGLGTSVQAASINMNEVVCVVSGLTPAGSYTWDAAYAVEATQASTNLKYGGPDNASGANAWGGAAFEIWDTPTLLGAVLYDPASAATVATTSLLAMTAIDTTNARITFTGPASGKVFFRIRVLSTGSATLGMPLLGILDGSTVKARVAPSLGVVWATIANGVMLDGSGLVSVTPSTSYTWDAAYAVQAVGAAGQVLKWGGPNNTSAGDAWGAMAYEIWTA